MMDSVLPDTAGTSISAVGSAAVGKALRGDWCAWDDSPSLPTLQRGATLSAGFGGIGGVAMTLATNTAATAGDWHGDFAGVDHSLFVTSPRIVLPGECGEETMPMVVGMLRLQ